MAHIVTVELARRLAELGCSSRQVVSEMRHNAVQDVFRGIERVVHERGCGVCRT